MRLRFWRPARGTNFGDELNLWLWPKVLAEGVLTGDGPELLGIGTLLDDRTNAPGATILGAGGWPTVRRDPSWKVYFVRGPLTARALGLPYHWITDPAALVSRFVEARGGEGWGFMPHINSIRGIDRYPLQRACLVSGLRFIDPGWPVEYVLGKIAGLDVLVTEAMHGAIVANALGIPWVPAFTSIRIAEHKAWKWQDWAQSVNVRFAPMRAPYIGRHFYPGSERLLVAGLRRLRNKARPICGPAHLIQERCEQMDEQFQHLAGDLRIRARDQVVGI